MEFHLRQVERLLMPTTTTSVAMRALHGGTDIGTVGGGEVALPPTSFLRPAIGEGGTKAGAILNASETTTDKGKKQLQMSLLKTTSPAAVHQATR